MTAKIAIVDKPIKADITDVADWFLLKGNISNKISLPCVSTPADIFLVFRTLLNCLKCIIYEDCYNFDLRNHCYDIKYSYTGLTLI